MIFCLSEGGLYVNIKLHFLVLAHFRFAQNLRKTNKNYERSINIVFFRACASNLEKNCTKKPPVSTALMLCQTRPGTKSAKKQAKISKYLLTLYFFMHMRPIWKILH